MIFEVMDDFQFLYSCGHDGTRWGTGGLKTKLERTRCPECKATDPKPGMLVKDLVAALKAKGFTHVQTFGPVLPLDKWDPYGMEGVNKTPTSSPYRGLIVEHEGQTEVHDIPHDHDSEFKSQRQLYLGIWKFITKEEE